MKWEEFLAVAFPEEMARSESDRDVIWRSYRWMGLRLGFVFYRLGMSGNGISIGALLVSIIGLYCISTAMNGNQWMPLMGAFLLQVGVLLDFCDGVVARASGKGNKLGKILDDIPLDFARTGILVLLGIFSENLFVIVISICASYILINVRNEFIKNGIAYDCKSEANVIQGFYRGFLSVVVMVGILPLLASVMNFMGVSMMIFSNLVVGIYATLACSWLALSVLTFTVAGERGKE